MPDLYLVTVVAESDDPIPSDRIDAWSAGLTTSLESSVAAQQVPDGLTVRSDRKGFDLAVLVEAESADDARRKAEGGALRGVPDGVDDGVRLELVRAEPAFAR